MTLEIVSAGRPIEEHFYNLPLPLSVNAAYATLPNGRRVSSGSKTHWTKLTKEQLDAAGFPQLLVKRGVSDYDPEYDAPRDDLTTQRDHNQFVVEMTVKLASWRRDIDNCVKLLLDVLCERLLLDDNYCIHLDVWRRSVDTKEEEGVAGWIYVYDPPTKGRSTRTRR